MVDADGRRTDGRRLDGYTISSPYEPNGSGELTGAAPEYTSILMALFFKVSGYALYNILSQEPSLLFHHSVLVILSVSMMMH